MEEKLDEVADGNIEWKKVLKDFYVPFEKNLEKVSEELEKIEIKDKETDVPCDKCGRMMVIKMGRYGEFMACPGFPECKNIKPILKKLDIPCPQCGGSILIKRSKKGKKYFICENNPDKCDFIAWNGPDKNGVIKAANLKEKEENKEKQQIKKTKKPAQKKSTKKETKNK